MESILFFDFLSLDSPHGELPQSLDSFTEARSVPHSVKFRTQASCNLASMHDFAVQNRRGF